MSKTSHSSGRTDAELCNKLAVCSDKQTHNHACTHAKACCVERKGCCKPPNIDGLKLAAGSASRTRRMSESRTPTRCVCQVTERLKALSLEETCSLMHERPPDEAARRLKENRNKFNTLEDVCRSFAPHCTCRRSRCNTAAPCRGRRGVPSTSTDSRQRSTRHEHTCVCWQDRNLVPPTYTKTKRKERIIRPRTHSTNTICHRQQP